MSRARVLGSLLVLASGVHGCRCGGAPAADDASGSASSEPAVVETRASRDGGAGLYSAPIGAAHGAAGEVFVAALDVPAKAIKLVKLDAKDAVSAERAVVEDVKWTSDADLKVVAAPGGGAGVTWRGLRAGRLGRWFVTVGPDLVNKSGPVEVSGASCATHDAVWFTDGKRAHARPWSGAALDLDLPRDKEPSIVCGATRAFALLEEDDGTSYLPLGAGKPVPSALFRESDFGEDEQRERAEYTVGDELGVVRLASSGAIAFREVKDGKVGALERAKTKIPHDDDVVAVDASPKTLAVFHTQDASAGCPDGQASSKVHVLRIDRATKEETTHELSPGTCAREVGPFFTGAVGDGVAVAWVERVPTAGKPKAPIVGLAYAFVPASGAVQTVKRIDVAADALVDAGCDAERCYAAALERKPGTDGMVPGPLRVLRYR